MTRINSAAELEQLRQGILSKTDPNKPRISICAGLSCLGLANKHVINAIKEEVSKQGLEEKVDVILTGCHGFCEQGPIVVIYPEEICYLQVKPEDAAEIVSQTVVGKQVIDRLIYKDPQTGEKIAHMMDIPFYKNQTRVLLGPATRLDPTSIDEYIAGGGYSAMAKALLEMKPEEVLNEVKTANLRGRGGGGFPAASKWETTRNAPNDTKYVIVNGHEGEPGAFMDRALFQGNPHSVIEGLVIGAYAIGAHLGFIYTRHDTIELRKNLDHALEQAKAYGLYGENILGSGFDLEIEVHFDVGIFVSGESSALMRSLEGKGPEPQPKYIRTSVNGIWQRPSNLNNIETWANVPHIINKGYEWYQSIGTEKSKGTKLLSLSGHVVNSCVIEVPMTTTLREIVYDFGGGIRNGKQLKAIHFGGPMGGTISGSAIDSPCDYESLSDLGASMGAGDLLIMDEDTCMVEMARYFVDFLSGESCGKCVPCRESIRQMQNILTRMTQGLGREGDLEKLEDIADVVGDAALCSLGRSIQKPLVSMLKYFRDEFEAHITAKQCPAKFCKALS